METKRAYAWTGAITGSGALAVLGLGFLSAILSFQLFFWLTIGAAVLVTFAVGFAAPRKWPALTLVVVIALVTAAGPGGNDDTPASMWAAFFLAFTGIPTVIGATAGILYRRKAGGEFIERFSRGAGST